MLLISCSQEVEIAEESFKIRVGSSALTFPSSKMWQSFENSSPLKSRGKSGATDEFDVRHGV